MIEVESARYIGSEGDVSVTVRLSSGSSGETFVFVVPIRFYEKSGIAVGEIDEERFESLATEAGIHGAFKRGLRILGYTSLSKRALAHRLVEKGVSKQDAAGAVERLEFYRYFNERKNAMRLVQLSLKKGWGRTRILADLRRKGYDASTCRYAEILLRPANFERRAARVIFDRFGGVPEDEKGKQKLERSLLTLGYSYSEINSAQALILECDDPDTLARGDLMDELCFE